MRAHTHHITSLNLVQHFSVILGRPITWNTHSNAQTHSSVHFTSHIQRYTCSSAFPTNIPTSKLGHLVLTKQLGRGRFLHGWCHVEKLWHQTLHACSLPNGADMYEYTMQHFPDHREAFICLLVKHHKHLLSSFPFSLRSFRATCSSL